MQMLVIVALHEFHALILQAQVVAVGSDVSSAAVPHTSIEKYGDAVESIQLLRQLGNEGSN